MEIKAKFKKTKFTSNYKFIKPTYESPLTQRVPSVFTKEMHSRCRVLPFVSFEQNKVRNLN